MNSLNAPKAGRLAAACLTLALGIPFAGLTQTVPTYSYDPTWPVYSGDAARIRRNEITGVATDASGRVYICQATRYPVMVFDRSGTYVGSWGWPTTTEPHSIRRDPEGNFWIADLDTHQVLKFTPDGRLLLALGVRRRKGADTTHFNRPTDMAFGRAGDVFISDGYGNSRVMHFTRDGRYLGQWGRHGSAPGQFRLPHSIATDASGLVYVADRENRRIQVFTSNGDYVREFDLADKPMGLWITPAQSIYICYETPCTIGVYDLQGNRLAYWGGRMKGRVPGNMADPHMLTVDAWGELYTAELRGHRAQRFLPH